MVFLRYLWKRNDEFYLYTKNADLLTEIIVIGPSYCPYDPL